MVMIMSSYLQIDFVETDFVELVGLLNLFYGGDLDSWGY